jgi:branched-chain amino acid transport system permease protein
VTEAQAPSLEGAAAKTRYFPLRGILPLAIVTPVLLAADHFIAQQYLLDVLYKIGFAIILAVSLNIVNGLTGQFSLGHAGFMAVGAFLASWLSLQNRQAHLDAAAGVPNALASLFPSHFAQASGSVDVAVVFLVSTLIGGLAAAVAGLLVGLPSLRLSGDYLAIVTLGFGEIIRVIIENTPALGRATGLVNIPRATNLFWVYGWAFATILVARRLTASTHGRALLAIREDEVAAEAMGVDTTDYKVRAFVLSSFFAGVAGSLMGHYQQSIQPASFTFIKSIDVVVMVTLGGLGSTSGSILAALVLTLAPELLRSVDQYRPVLYSELLIALMLVRPTGLLGTRELWEVIPEQLARWRRPHAALAVSSARIGRPLGITVMAAVFALATLGAPGAFALGVASASVALTAAIGCAASAAGLWSMRPWGRGVAFCWAFVLLNAGGIGSFELLRDTPPSSPVAGALALRLVPVAAAFGLFYLTSRYRAVFER